MRNTTTRPTTSSTSSCEIPDNDEEETTAQTPKKFRLWRRKGNMVSASTAATSVSQQRVSTLRRKPAPNHAISDNNNNSSMLSSPLVPGKETTNAMNSTSADSNPGEKDTEDYSCVAQTSVVSGEMTTTAADTLGPLESPSYTTRTMAPTTTTSTLNTTTTTASATTQMLNPSQRESMMEFLQVQYKVLVEIQQRLRQGIGTVEDEIFLRSLSSTSSTATAVASAAAPSNYSNSTVTFPHVNGPSNSSLDTVSPAIPTSPSAVYDYNDDFPPSWAEATSASALRTCQSQSASSTFQLCSFLKDAHIVCQCCFEEIPPLSPIITCSCSSFTPPQQQQHAFCITCVRRYVQCWVYENQPYPLVPYHLGPSNITGSTGNASNGDEYILYDDYEQDNNSMLALPCLSAVSTMKSTTIPSGKVSGGGSSLTFSCCSGVLTHQCLQPVLDEQDWEHYQERMFMFLDLGITHNTMIQPSMAWT